MHMNNIHFNRNIENLLDLFTYRKLTLESTPRLFCSINELTKISFVPEDTKMGWEEFTDLTFHFGQF